MDNFNLRDFVQSLSETLDIMREKGVYDKRTDEMTISELVEYGKYLAYESLYEELYAEMVGEK